MNLTKKILLLGKTGAGKTTFVQMAHEHDRRSKYESPRDFIVPIMIGNTNIGTSTDNNEQSSIHSQTKDLKIYSMSSKNIEFIDTQGLFDTEGISLHDLGNVLSNYVAENAIHAICLVISGSDARITNQVKDLFFLVDQIFGDNKAKKNFFVLVTFCIFENKNIQLLLNDYVDDVKQRIFYFDNSCIIPEESESIKSEYKSMIWNEHEKQYDEFIKSVSALEPLESVIFQERANLFRNIKQDLLQKQDTQQNVLKLSSDLEKLNENISLIQTHKYKKWSCGFTGPTLPINTTQTPVFGTKRQGGIGGMMGGTKSYLSHYNTTTSCGNCGGVPGFHTSQEMVKFDQVETPFINLLDTFSKQKAVYELQQIDYETQLNNIEKNLQFLNEELNKVGHQRDYILEFQKQLSAA